MMMYSVMPCPRCLARSWRAVAGLTGMVASLAYLSDESQCHPCPLPAQSGKAETDKDVTRGPATPKKPGASHSKPGTPQKNAAQRCGVQFDPGRPERERLISTTFMRFVL